MFSLYFVDTFILNKKWTCYKSSFLCERARDDERGEWRCKRRGKVDLLNLQDFRLRFAPKWAGLNGTRLPLRP